MPVFGGISGFVQDDVEHRWDFSPQTSAWIFAAQQHPLRRIVGIPDADTVKLLEDIEVHRMLQVEEGVHRGLLDEIRQLEQETRFAQRLSDGSALEARIFFCVRTMPSSSAGMRASRSGGVP